MHPTQVFSETYLVLLFTFLGSYFIGYVCNLFIEGKKGWIQELKILLLGNLVSVCIYAMIKTNLYTILVLSLSFPIFFLIYQIKFYKKQFFYFNKIQLNYLLLTIAFLSFFYILSYTQIYNPFNREILGFAEDYGSYIRFATNLNLYGIENINLHQLILSSTCPTPYHYGDLWHIAMLSNITGTNCSTSFSLYYIPISLTVIYCATLTLVSLKHNHLKWLDYIFASVIIVICTPSFYFNCDSLISKYNGLDDGIILMTKSYFVSALVISSIVFLKTKNYFCLNFSVAFLFFYYMALLPVFFISLLVFNHFLFRRDEISKKKYVYYSLFSISTIAFCCIFYLSLNQIETNIAPSIFFENDFVSIINGYIRSIKDMVLIFRITFVKLIPYLLIITIAIPYKSVLSKARSMVLSQSFIWLTVLYGTSVLCGILFGFMIDGIQFFYITNNFIVPVFIFLLIQNSLNEERSYRKLVLFFIVYCSSVFQNLNSDRSRFSIIPIDQKFVSEIMAIAKNNKLNSNVCFIEKEEDNSTPFFYNSDLHIPYPYLISYYEFYNPICISFYNLEDAKYSNLNKIKSANVFYKYVQNLKSQNRFLSIEDAQLQFIKNYKIEFIFYRSNCHLSKIILDKTIEQISSTDKKWIFARLQK